MPAIDPLNGTVYKNDLTLGMNFDHFTVYDDKVLYKKDKSEGIDGIKIRSGEKSEQSNGAEDALREAISAKFNALNDYLGKESGGVFHISNLKAITSSNEPLTKNEFEKLCKIYNKCLDEIDYLNTKKDDDDKKISEQSWDLMSESKKKEAEKFFESKLKKYRLSKTSSSKPEADSEYKTFLSNRMSSIFGKNDTVSSSKNNQNNQVLYTKPSGVIHQELISIDSKKVANDGSKWVENDKNFTEIKITNQVEVKYDDDDDSKMLEVPVKPTPKGPDESKKDTIKSERPVGEVLAKKNTVEDKESDDWLKMSWNESVGKDTTSKKLAGDEKSKEFDQMLKELEESPTNAHVGKKSVVSKETIDFLDHIPTAQYTDTIEPVVDKKDFEDFVGTIKDKAKFEPKESTKAVELITSTELLHKDDSGFVKDNKPIETTGRVDEYSNIDLDKEFDDVDVVKLIKAVNDRFDEVEKIVNGDNDGMPEYYNGPHGDINGHMEDDAEKRIDNTNPFE